VKKTTILAALLIMTASPAMAQPWKHLGTDSGSTSYFFNPKTFSASKDNIITTWTKKEFNVDTAALAKAKVSPDMFKGTKSIAAYEEFDCSKKKKRTLTGMSFENGKSTDLKKTNWLEVVPGSLDGNLINALCQELKAPEH
jgi:hypothetical protein